MTALKLFSLANVPSGGQAELQRYRNQASTHRVDVALWTVLSGLFFVLAFFPLMPGVATLVFSAIGTGVLLKAGHSFLRLAKLSPYHMLPEGATHHTAQLEDALTKRIRAWNEVAGAWNTRFHAWQRNMTECRRLRATPNENDFEWTPQALDDFEQGLLAEEVALEYERRELAEKQRGIEDEHSGLAAEIRNPLHD